MAVRRSPSIWTRTSVESSQREGQSFSQVIKEIVPPIGSTAGDLLAAIRSVEVSDATLDAIDRVIEERPKSPVRVPDW